ncbi:type III secretion system export apparatus subunit SctV [Citrobacter freundii]|nr:type III secretion system export apparatus subunit SctV [Citrobacter freundii]
MTDVSLSVFSKVAKHHGSILAAVLVLAVFMMILPLPTGVVDVLIAVNLMFSIIILMVVVYLRSPIEFSAFPSLLLITTLYRLSLTVSTSRLILLQHDAGNIVSAFGYFVVGGNLAVGLIIYAIITVVQFIVITKGSERVAEVCARFSLDGMPGKQMSIDGDLRAGSISTQEAAILREQVQQESKLYGAMDGAMKFVKGDAIASIIVILVNIFGGMAIGVIHDGMSASEALRIYSVLSVGDGLVAQIPALLISVTSGILVTRVPDVRGDRNLATELFSQLGSRSAPLLIAAIVLAIFACVPGFPAMVFLPIAAVIGGFGLFLRRLDADRANAKATEGEIKLAPGVDPANIRVGSTLPEMALSTALDAVRWHVFDVLGIALGPVKVDAHRPEADPHQVSFCLYGETVVTLTVDPDTPYLLAPGAAEYPETTIQQILLPGIPLVWLDEAGMLTAVERGDTVYDRPRALAWCMEQILIRHAREFIGVQETRYLIDAMELTHAELVKELQRQVQMTRLTDVLQRLVEERVSIRDMRTIFETLIAWAAKEKDMVTLTEYVRVSLKRQIVNRHVTDGVTTVWVVGGNIEAMVRESIRQTVSGAYSALEPEKNGAILEAVRDAVRGERQGILLTTIDVRRYIRKIIEAEFCDFSVLSFQEVSDVTSFELRGNIDLMETV